MRSIPCPVVYAFAVLVVRVGQLRAAERSLEYVLRHCPTHLGAEYYLAWTLTKRGAFERAASHYRNVLHVVPTSVSVLLGLAGALQELEQHDEAIEVFFKAADLETGKR